MNDQIKKHLDEVFRPYENSSVSKELKEEILNDMLEKYDDLIKDGMDKETAYKKTISSLGDIAEIIENISDKTDELHRKINLNFSMSNLVGSKLDSVNLKSGNFNYSDLENSDFCGSDLTGSSFKSSNLNNSKFEKANLSGTLFKHSNLENCNFNSANLTSAQLIRSCLDGSSFQNSILDNAEFKYSDLREVSFDNLILNGTVFDHSGLKKASFRNSILNGVSFRTDVRKTIFDGATMDKITFALLKGYKADLKNVKII